MGDLSYAAPLIERWEREEKEKETRKRENKGQDSNLGPLDSSDALSLELPLRSLVKAII